MEYLIIGIVIVIFLLIIANVRRRLISSMKPIINYVNAMVMFRGANVVINLAVKN